MSDNFLKKDAWLAVNLSMFFPGIGQIYAGKNYKGLILLSSQISLITFSFWSIFAAEGNTITGLITVIIAIIVYLINLFDAFHSVHEDQENPPSEKIPRQIKNPWFAVFLSRILPGLGQLYLEKFPSATFFLISIIIFSFLDDLLTSLLIVSPLITALATYHSYLIFSRRRKSLIAVITGLVLVSGLIFNYFPQVISRRFIPFEIPSGSMQPTLTIGDRILVTRNSKYQPERGDLIVFKAPEKAQELDPEPSSKPVQFYVKRLIGKPGETLAVDEGVVYINEQPLKEDYIAELPDYQWGPNIIPNGFYFMLGDNRNESFDSHAWGYLSQDKIIGKAYKIYWPPSRVRSLK
jgi:signal peptidase I